MTNPSIMEKIVVFNERHENYQHMMTRHSKFYWVSEYATDIFKTLMESETRRLPIKFLSIQLAHRPQLIKLCQLMTRTFNFSRCTLHLSIYYLDRFIDVFNLRQDKLQLAAVTCLHIAGQIENRDAVVPRYSEMNRVIKDCYMGFEYKAMERQVLSFLQFDLIRPTTASFVEMLACSFLTQDDYESYTKTLDDCPEFEETYPRFECLEQMLASLAKVLLLMADYTLYVHKFTNESPSLLAAACIASVRQVSGLPQVWTPHLTKLTSYTENVVEPYTEIIVLYHYYHCPVEICKQSEAKTRNQKKTKQSPDSGFEEHLCENVAVEVDNLTFTTLDTPSAYKDSTTHKRSRDLLCEEQPHSKRSKLEMLFLDQS